MAGFKADVNARDRYMKSPLHIAVTMAGYMTLGGCGGQGLAGRPHLGGFGTPRLFSAQVYTLVFSGTCIIGKHTKIHNMTRSHPRMDADDFH